MCHGLAWRGPATHVLQGPGKGKSWVAGASMPLGGPEGRPGGGGYDTRGCEPLLSVKLFGGWYKTNKLGSNHDKRPAEASAGMVEATMPACVIPLLSEGSTGAARDHVVTGFQLASPPMIVELSVCDPFIVHRETAPEVFCHRISDFPSPL